MRRRHAAAAPSAMPDELAERRAIVLQRLPVQLRMLVRLMGEAPAYRLVQERGGTVYTVPKHVRSAAFEQLVDIVQSREAALALWRECEGMTLQLPKYDSVLRQLRHQRVVELRQESRTLAEVALATGYTVRQVITICQRAGIGTAADDLAALARAAGQGDLFGEIDA